MELANVSNKDDEIKKMECVYTCMHMHIYVHMCVCVWTCMCLCTHAHSCLQRNFIQRREESNYVFCRKIVESGDHHIK